MRGSVLALLFTLGMVCMLSPAVMASKKSGKEWSKMAEKDWEVRPPPPLAFNNDFAAKK
jgi:hypothetical protein